MILKEELFVSVQYFEKKNKLDRKKSKIIKKNTDKERKWENSEKID